MTTVNAEIVFKWCLLF